MTTSSSIAAEDAAIGVGLSVVLGSYNRRHFLKAAIESLRNNRIPIPYEIIVVDGGSTDGSLRWLLEQKDIITIVQHNRGEFRGKPIRRRSWGYFMNLGFRVSHADWILMISDDCLLLEGAVSRSLEFASKLQKRNRKIGGVAYYFRNWPSEDKYYVQETIGGRLMVNHGLFAREALEAVGFANEADYMFYKADGDLNLKIWEAGYEIVDCPGAIVEHYLDYDETIRVSNNAIADADRRNYLARWGHLKGSRRRIEIKTVDSSGTAQRIFGPLSQLESEND